MISKEEIQMELCAKHGVTTWKRDKAYAGYTLFTPMMITRRQLEGKQLSSVAFDLTIRPAKAEEDHVNKPTR